MLCRMERLAVIGRTRVALRWCFLDKSLESKKDDAKNGHCPVVFWTHEPLLDRSQHVQSLAACFMPPEVLANEMSYED